MSKREHLPVGLKANHHRSFRDKSGGPDFFRYHGLWAPGVRLFRNLGFAGKAAIISVVFLLSVIVLGWNYFPSVNEQIRSTRTEREGVAILTDFAPVLHGILNTRNATRAMLGGYDATANYADARSQTDAAIARLQRNLAQRGDPLGVSSEVVKLKASWDATANAKNGVDEHGRTVFGPVSASLIELLNSVGDSSQLVLDPDLDSFYLVSALVLVLPRTIEDVGQVWGWGTFAALRGGIGSEEEAKWHVWSSQIVTGIDETRSAVKHVVSANSTLASRFDLSPLDGALDLRKAGQAAVLEAAAPRADAYYAQGESAVKGMIDMYGRMLVALDELLAARQTRLTDGRTGTVLALAVSLLMAAYFFLSFRRVLEGGMRAVAFHIDAIRDGDLTTEPRAWGKDEVASLIGSLTGMQESLRRIVSQVRSVSEHIVVASAQISGGANDLSARTEQSAASLQESAAAMEEISSTVKHTAGNARDAAGLSLESVSAAGRGKEVIDTMVDTMQSIDASSRRITDIIGTIDGIAFQTNILALNAAVEAARAGDSGRGFSVVASEVRALAQRTSTAAREIKGLIATSVAHVNSGSSVVDTVGQTVAEITETTRKVHQILAEIARAAEDESRGVAQTTQAVQEMDAVTQQNAALVEQTAAASLAMKQQAGALAAEVAKFRLPAAA